MRILFIDKEDEYSRTPTAVEVGHISYDNEDKTLFFNEVGNDEDFWSIEIDNTYTAKDIIQKIFTDGFVDIRDYGYAVSSFVDTEIL